MHPQSGGDWHSFPTVVLVVAHLKDKGMAIGPTQVSRAAQQGSTKNRWSFHSTDLNAADGEHEVPAPQQQDFTNTTPHGVRFLHTYIHGAFLWVL